MGRTNEVVYVLLPWTDDDLEENQARLKWGKKSLCVFPALAFWLDWWRFKRILWWLGSGSVGPSNLGHGTWINFLSLWNSFFCTVTEWRRTAQKVNITVFGASCCSGTSSKHQLVWAFFFWVIFFTEQDVWKYLFFWNSFKSCSCEVGQWNCFMWKVQLLQTEWLNDRILLLDISVQNDPRTGSGLRTRGWGPLV